MWPEPSCRTTLDAQVGATYARYEHSFGGLGRCDRSRLGAKQKTPPAEADGVVSVVWIGQLRP